MRKKLLKLLKQHPGGIGLQRLGRELRLGRHELPQLKKLLQELESQAVIQQVGVGFRHGKHRYRQLTIEISIGKTGFTT